MSEKGLELLAPAGSLQIFKQVIDAGADAVYFGGSSFGARAYAKNLDVHDAETAVRYAHQRGRKAYLTLNTLLKQQEMESVLYPYLKTYYELGIDAVIVQDYGIFCMARDYAPDLKLHISTQMNTCSSYGAQFLSEAGADRIVTARELSIDEIKRIYEDTGIEIECFVHGALCVCYSGQCLMSSMIGGRSGNRGKCAQPCRLPYSVYEDREDKAAKKLPGSYPLSPKDLCGIEHIPALSDAGVYSLKIEGRMKGAAYAAGVVAIYRKYVDMFLKDGAEKYRVKKQDMEKLLSLGNRNGFTSTYYEKQNDPSMISYITPSHKHEESHENKNTNSRISIDPGYRDQVVIDRREGSPMAAYPYWDMATGDPADSSFETKMSVKPLYASVMNAEQAKICMEDKNVTHILLSADIAVKLSDKQWLKLVSDIKDNNKQAGLMLPEIMRYRSVMEMDGIFASHRLSQLRFYMTNSFDGLEYLKERRINTGRIIAGERLYTYSDITLRRMNENGLLGFTVPLELNERELIARDLSDSSLMIYGYIPMMITANCINHNVNGCDKCERTLYLKDRKHASFPVRNHCKFCYNIIYNHLPMSLFLKANEVDRVKVSSYRIAFTIEDADEVRSVLYDYDSCFIRHDMSGAADRVTTYGHFKRGVE